MSVFLKNDKYWQKVTGQVKLKPVESLFLPSSNEWIDVETYIPFPIEVNETIDSLFLDFATFDLNSKKINKVTIVEFKNVRLV